jgi:hypothetical protein
MPSFSGTQLEHKRRAGCAPDMTPPLNPPPPPQNKSCHSHMYFNSEPCIHYSTVWSSCGNCIKWSLLWWFVDCVNSSLHFFGISSS